MDYQWFADSLNATGAAASFEGGAPTGIPCRLAISSELSSTYRTHISSSGVELSGKDKLGLTYACLDFLDSVRTHGAAFYANAAERSWDFTPKTSARIVMLTQSPPDHWPKARTQLLNAIHYGRASEVIISGEPTVWRPGSVAGMDAMLSICDQYGIQARLLTATFSKWWRGDVPTSRCLRAGIPLHERRNPPAPAIRLDPAIYTGKIISSASGDSNRLYIPVDFPRNDDTYRLWTITYQLRADPAIPNARMKFMWYRNSRYADSNTDAIVVTSQYLATDSWVTYRDTVCSLEQPHWIAHFQSIRGRMWLDSVRIEEISPVAWDRVSCSNDLLLPGWYEYQKRRPSTYLSPMSLRPELDSSMTLIAQTMDSCYSRFHHHPSFIGFFSACDEVYVMGWDSAFMRTYSNAGEGYVDLLRKIAGKSHDLFPSSRLLFYGDMLDPYQNGKVYTRACNPHGGGFKGSRRYVGADTTKLDILLWGEDNPAICRALVDTFRYGWTWTAGVTIGNRGREVEAWRPLHPSRVCYFDWGDDFFAPAIMRNLKERWYQ